MVNQSEAVRQRDPFVSGPRAQGTSLPAERTPEHQQHPASCVCVLRLHSCCMAPLPGLISREQAAKPGRVPCPVPSKGEIRSESRALFTREGERTMDESHNSGRSRKQKKRPTATVCTPDQQTERTVKLISITAFFIHTTQGVCVCECMCVTPIGLQGFLPSCSPTRGWGGGKKAKGTRQSEFKLYLKRISENL